MTFTGLRHTVLEFIPYERVAPLDSDEDAEPALDAAGGCAIGSSQGGGAALALFLALAALLPRRRWARR